MSRINCLIIKLIIKIYNNSLDFIIIHLYNEINIKLTEVCNDEVIRRSAIKAS